MIVYYLILLITLILSIIFSVIEPNYEHNNPRQRPINYFRGYIFLSLIIIFIVFAWSLFRTLIKLKLSLQKVQRIKFFMMLLLLYTLIFVFRCVWDLCDAYKVNSVNDKLRESIQDDHNGIFYTVFFFWYFLLEVLPILIIIIVFHHQISFENKLLEFIDPETMDAEFFQSSRTFVDSVNKINGNEPSNEYNIYDTNNMDLIFSDSESD
ncbi:integral membrane protein [Anaeramoeba flamelloides]|uniref:Integral membrane protein n=1 Tax=Anaeramoeba flamelloides TaxID=1746091 RepID=A0AAV7ZNP6_9EUKA|nr:integral membrane protein [Anaeramoeba flamelloides]